MMKTGWFLGGLTGLQIAFSLLAQLLVLRLVGPGVETDAYVAAQAVPLVLAAVFAAALQSAWQPRLAVLAHDPGRWRTAQAAAQGQTLLLAGLPALATALLAGVWIPLLFPGFGEAQRQLTLAMTPPLLAAGVLYAHAVVFIAAERARNRFLATEATSALLLLLALIAIAWAVPRYGVEAAAWIQLGRSALLAVLLHAFAGRPALSLRAALADRPGWRQLRTIAAAAALYKLSPLVDRYWSSRAPTGGLTLYGLAQAGMGSVALMVERAFVTPAVPQLARLLHEGQKEAASRLCRRSVVRAAVAALLLAAVLLALRPWGIEGLRYALQLRMAPAAQLWDLALLLLGFLFASAAAAVLVAAFHAMGRAEVPAKVGVIGFLISLVLKAAGFLSWGLVGLAAATSIYYLGNLVALALLLRSELHARRPAA